MTKKSVTFDLSWRKARAPMSGYAPCSFVKAAAPCCMAPQSLVGEQSLKETLWLTGDGSEGGLEPCVEIDKDILI